MAYPPGYIPESGQGLQAKAEQEGTEGGKYWLKHLKLHKYWPMFSHWSYTEFMSLEEDNIDQMVEKINASGLTNGAKGKLLRSIADLRKREATLLSIQTAIKTNKLQLSDTLQYLQEVVHTPLPTDPQDTLSETIIATVKRVFLYISSQKCYNWVYNNMDTILNAIAKRPILQNLMEKKYPMKPFQESVETENKKIGSFRERRPTEDSGFSEEVTINYERVYKNLPVHTNAKNYIQSYRTQENLYKKKIQNSRTKENFYYKKGSSFNGQTNCLCGQKNVENISFRNVTNNCKFQERLTMKSEEDTSFFPSMNHFPLYNPIIHKTTYPRSTVKQNSYQPFQRKNNVHYPFKTYSGVVRGNERNTAQMKQKLPSVLRPVHITNRDNSSGIHYMNITNPLPPKSTNTLHFFKHKWNDSLSGSYALPGVGGKIVEEPSFKSLPKKYCSQKLSFNQYQNNNPQNSPNNSGALGKQNQAYHNASNNLLPMYAEKNKSFNTISNRHERQNTNIFNPPFKVNDLNKSHFGLLCGVSPSHNSFENLYNGGVSPSHNSYENLYNVPFSSSDRKKHSGIIQATNSFYTQTARPLSPNSYFLNATSTLASEIVESVLKDEN